jgi:hypothetical protein
MSPSGPHSIRSKVDRVISTFSFDPNLEPSPQNLHRGEASGPPELVSGMTGHLPRGIVECHMGVMPTPS